jgi:hypothetical protein
MQNPQVVPHFFVPAEQHPPAPIPPAMRALHHPPSCFATGLVLPGLGLLPPPAARRRASARVQHGSPLVVVIAFVPTHPLGGVWRGGRPCHGPARDRLAWQLAIMPLGAVHGQTERHATAVGEDAAFGAALAAVRGVLASLCPPQGGLGASRRPSPAPPSPSLARPHMPPSPVPRRPPRRPPPPTLGNGDGRHSWNSSASCAAPSPGTRGGARTRWPPALGDHRRGANGPLKGAVSVGAATAQCAPTMRQVYASLGGFSRGLSASVRLLRGRIVPHRIPDHTLMG